MKKAFTILSIINAIISYSQTNLPFDVQHYRYEIEVNDRNDSVSGSAHIKLLITQPTKEIRLNLSNVRNQKGMLVKRIYLDSNLMIREGWRHNNNTVNITLGRDRQPNDTVHLRIDYAGIPANGLIIARNKFGNRTFFSDNWPDRAQHWMPCVDHPADKSTVEFLITAPSHYQVVSNGILAQEIDLPGNKRMTHWSESQPLPTKIMVIGIAKFAVQLAGIVNGVPVYSWVYPENRAEGFYDYASATEILPFFTSYIGAYPYSKLANIQSKTMFGGMENAGAIFYSESSVTGRREHEGLIAHEIAHQWFGNMASEKNFSHLWLSEGFATYLTNLYMEQKYGEERMKTMLRQQREQVIRFAKSEPRAVVDENTKYMELLNANSYQKGGWILHMLRQAVGSQSFQKILGEYYKRYAGGNADSDDFKNVAEEISGKELDQFFTQWLRVPGNPNLEVSWTYQRQERVLKIKVVQRQDIVYRLPLDIQVRPSSGESVIYDFVIDEREENFELPLKEEPVELILDPEVRLLFEGVVRKG